MRGWFPASYVELLLPPKPGQNQLEQEVEVEVEVAGSGGDDGAQDGDEAEALEEVAEAASSLASTVVKPMAGYVAPKAAFASSGLCVSARALRAHRLSRFINIVPRVDPMSDFYSVSCACPFLAAVAISRRRPISVVVRVDSCAANICAVISALFARSVLCLSCFCFCFSSFPFFRCSSLVLIFARSTCRSFMVSFL